MILSHKYRFIFIKTHKTAGTSVEIALSKYCGPKDVITVINPEDEDIRRELGYPGPQNYLKPFGRYNKRDWWCLIHRRERAIWFRNHIWASTVRKRVGEEVWGSYYKFCFERNPWDKTLSWYFYASARGNEDRPLERFIEEGGAKEFSDMKAYCGKDGLLVDRVCRYENIEGEMKEFAERVGLPEVPALPRAKGSFRKNRKPLAEVLAPDMRDRIARDLSREVEFFGYTFEEAAAQQRTARAEASKP